MEDHGYFDGVGQLLLSHAPNRDNPGNLSLFASNNVIKRGIFYLKFWSRIGPIFILILWLLCGEGR